MTITLCGENTYAALQALATLRAAFVAKHGANAIERLEGADTTLAQLREQVSALSLFAPQRLIILKNPSAQKELFTELGDLAAEVGEGTTLVIVDGVLDKRTKTYKTLKAKTDFRDYAPLSDRELQQWVAAAVQERSGTITPQATAQLIDRVGNDQWQLTSEIDKLVALDKTVSADNVELLTTPNLEVSAFALLDAVMAGKHADAARLLTQMKMRSDPYEFFGLLVWQVHALALVAFAPGGLSSTELSQQTGLKPFVLQKSQQLVRRLGQAKIKAVVEQIAQLDMQLKSTGVEPWLLVEQALGKVARV
ncbi:MAG TPA: DNA polymerase III subunit delta [Candidatus Saccharimonadales bacterium]|nr:DNA polymerase III subunit delta [Candidatus Saccharimonadales bacterium]